jgi:hypothetical protein
MYIYISKDYNGNPTALILADNSEKARIAFNAMQSDCHSMEEINLNDPEILQMAKVAGGVLFILTSKERRTGGLNDRVYREWYRGLAPNY